MRVVQATAAMSMVAMLLAGCASRSDRAAERSAQPTPVAATAPAPVVDVKATPEYRALEAKLRAAEAAAKQRQEQADDLQPLYRKAQEQIIDLQAQLEEANAKVAAAQSVLESTRKELETAKAQLRDYQQQK